MGLWREQLFPRLAAWGMRGATFAEQRARIVPLARGRVLELGFGAGLNLPFYGREVAELVALEPLAVNRDLAAARVRAAPFPVRFVLGAAGEGGEDLLEPASFDCVVSTWTMCSIERLDRALSRVRGLLRPGGALCFVEHGLAPAPRTALWQRRLTPLQRRVAGGCRLDRAIGRELEAAGFVLDELEELTLAAPRVLGWTYRGVARPRSAAAGSSGR